MPPAIHANNTALSLQSSSSQQTHMIPISSSNLYYGLATDTNTNSMILDCILYWPSFALLEQMNLETIDAARRCLRQSTQYFEAVASQALIFTDRNIASAEEQAIFDEPAFQILCNCFFPSSIF